MSIVDTDLVVLSPATAPTPPDVAPPEPPLRLVHKRRTRRSGFAGVALFAAIAGLAAAIAVWSPWSASTAPGAQAVTPAPSYVQVIGVTPTSIAFRWSPPMTDASVVAYEIVRNGVVADVVMPAESTYDATGLATGRSYRFQIIAVYDDAVSAPTAPIVALTH